MPYAQYALRYDSAQERFAVCRAVVRAISRHHEHASRYVSMHSVRINAFTRRGAAYVDGALCRPQRYAPVRVRRFMQDAARERLSPTIIFHLSQGFDFSLIFSLPLFSHLLLDIDAVSPITLRC